MKALPTVWNVLDVVDALSFKYLRKQKTTLSSLETAKARAKSEYDNVVGRFDVDDRVVGRTLKVENIDDVEPLLSLGAAYDEERDRWFVPDNIPDTKLRKFYSWMPPMPRDLGDSEARLIRTKNGRPIEGNLLLQDREKGDDTLATPLIYMAFPVLAAFTYLMTALHPIFGLLSTVFIIPFVVALKQGEGFTEALWTLVSVYLAPLLLGLATPMLTYQGAGVLGSIPGIGAALGQLDQVWIIGGLIKGLALVLPFFMIGLVARLLFFIIGSNSAAGTVIGGAFEQFKHAFKWSIVGSVVAGIALSLPFGMGPIAFFVMAAFAPLNYAEKNFIARAEELKEQGESFNLGGSEGSLAETTGEIRLQQARRAVADASPMIMFGIAMGYLSSEHYAYAPDAGAPMSLSCKDMSMHFLGFGSTGVGKTTNYARGVLLQYKASGYGGAFVRDGKQTLAAEMRQIIDIMVEPGVRLALIEGLSGKEVAIAINSFANSGDPRSAIWENGASNVIDHATTIHEALCAHEPSYRQLAIDQTRSLENQLDWLHAEMTKRANRGEDLKQAQISFAQVKLNKDNWAIKRDADRKYLWNIDTLLKVINAMNDVQMNNGVASPGKAMREMAAQLGFNADDARMKSAPGSIHFDIGKSSLLDGSLAYVFGAWCSLAPEQRSSFMMNVMDRIIPLVRGKDLCDENGIPWYMLEKGIDVGQALYGKFVGMNIAANEHGRAADVIQALVRQRIYSGVKKRAKYGNKWEQKLPGQMPVLDMCDECQMIVGKEESDLAPVARSLGLMMVYFTQGFESLAARFNNVNETAKFCNTFQSISAMNCSQETIEYLVKRFGEVQKISRSLGGVGLNYNQGLNDWHNSSLNDLNNPYRAVYRKMEQLGGNKLVGQSGKTNSGGEWTGHQVKRKSAALIGHEIVANKGSRFVSEPLFKLGHYNEILKGQGTAVLFLQRAGVPRADIAQLNYVSDRTLDLLESHEVEVLEAVRISEASGRMIEAVVAEKIQR